MAHATTVFTEWSDTLNIRAVWEGRKLAYQVQPPSRKGKPQSSIDSFISVGRRLEGKGMLAKED
jgi:hypothetical protein